MAASIRRLVSRISVAGSLRAIAAIVLFGYVGLASEAIHCQYFPSTHDQHAEHSTDPVPATDHAVHCLVANHAGSVIVHSDNSTPLPALVPRFRIVQDEGSTLFSHLVGLTPVRAPPLS